MVVLQYLLVIYLVAIEYFSPVLLVVLLSLIKNNVFKVFLKTRPQTKPSEYPSGINIIISFLLNFVKDVWPMWYFAAGLDQNRKFASFLLLGLVVDAFL